MREATCAGERTGTYAYIRTGTHARAHTHTHTHTAHDGDELDQMLRLVSHHTSWTDGDENEAAQRRGLSCPDASAGAPCQYGHDGMEGGKKKGGGRVAQLHKSKDLVLRAMSVAAATAVPPGTGYLCCGGGMPSPAVLAHVIGSFRANSFRLLAVGETRAATPTLGKLPDGQSDAGNRNSLLWLASTYAHAHKHRHTRTGARPPSPLSVSLLL